MWDKERQAQDLAFKEQAEPEEHGGGGGGADTRDAGCGQRQSTRGWAPCRDWGMWGQEKFLLQVWDA